MRQAVIYAALIAWGLEAPASIWAESSRMGLAGAGGPIDAGDAGDAGDATEAAGTAEEMGVPWVVSMEFGGHALLQAPSDAPGTDGYQLRMVHAVTAQPWRLLQAHAAWRYRETMAPGFTQPYREPAGAQGSLAVEAVPGLLYAWAGLSLPLTTSKAPLADSIAWDAFLSRHSTLPDPGMVEPTTVQVGGLMRLQTDPVLFLTGASYQLPTAFTALAGQRFRPPWILRLSLQGDIATDEGRHRLQIQWTQFGAERTREGHEAHVEAPLVAMRYALDGMGESGLWALAVGFAARWRDHNRQTMLDLPPPVTEAHDNLQRGYVEVARSFAKSPFRITWIVLQRNEVKWQPSENRLYLESSSELRMARKVFSRHGMDLRGTGKIGSNLTGIYYGVGGRIVLSLRHLGMEGVPAQ